MTTNELEQGARVEILAPYIGGGAYGRDEFTGRIMHVVGTIGGCNCYGGAVVDYKLATNPGEPWEVIIHSSRLRPAK